MASSSSELVAKRLKVTHAFKVSDMRVADLHKILAASGSPSGSSTLRTMRRHIYSDIDVATPFGPLVDTLELPLVNGGTVHFAVCRPLAFLYHVTKYCPRFAGLLRTCSSHVDEGRLLMYTDETYLGNPLHYDQPQNVFTFYWLGP